MNRVQKLKFYASAKRATAIKIHKIEDGDFVHYWVGRLNGKNVTMQANHKHKSKEKALQDARAFRESCRRELAEMNNH